MRSSTISKEVILHLQTRVGILAVYLPSFLRETLRALYVTGLLQMAQNASRRTRSPKVPSDAPRIPSPRVFRTSTYTTAIFRVLNQPRYSHLESGCVFRFFLTKQSEGDSCQRTPMWYFHQYHGTHAVHLSMAATQILLRPWIFPNCPCTQKLPNHASL